MVAFFLVSNRHHRSLCRRKFFRGFRVQALSLLKEFDGLLRLSDCPKIQVLGLTPLDSGQYSVEFAVTIDCRVDPMQLCIELACPVEVIACNGFTGLLGQSVDNHGFRLCIGIQSNAEQVGVRSTELLRSVVDSTERCLIHRSLHQ
ncbi:hypothetical protein D3C76_1036780 [compost metagenome]